jgi:hypothetical protein
VLQRHSHPAAQTRTIHLTAVQASIRSTIAWDYMEFGHTSDRGMCCIPSKPCLRPFPLPGPLLLYLQPLSLLFPTFRRSALPGENTAVGESSYGPDWHCGTLPGHSHSLSEVTAPSQRQRAMALGSQTFNYRDRFWLAVPGPVSSSWWPVWGSRRSGGWWRARRARWMV